MNQQLLKAFHAASNAYGGALALFSALAPHLSPVGREAATAELARLEAAARAAESACEATSAYEAQQRGIAHLQAA